jgi:hypothetical protein
MKNTYFVLLLFFVLISCKEKIKTDSFLEDNIRSYFFMNDSIPIQTKIIDTIFRNELLQLEKELDNDINYVQHQIDTLDLYVNLWENKMFNLIDEKANECDINNAQLFTNTYQLNQLEYRIKLNQLLSNRRINLGLKRAANDTIMGYETEVIYSINNNNDTLIVLMNAEFKIID